MNHRSSQLDSIVQSIKLPQQEASFGSGAFNFIWTDEVGEGSFKDDAMCTQLTVARNTA